MGPPRGGYPPPGTIFWTQKPGRIPSHGDENPPMGSNRDPRRVPHPEGGHVSVGDMTPLWGGGIKIKLTNDA